MGQNLRTISFGGRKILPMMLSPMAGITNLPFRELCNDFARLGLHGEANLANSSNSNVSVLSDSFSEGTKHLTLTTTTTAGAEQIEPGFFVNEMLAARALAGRIYKVRSKLQFANNEHFRSQQLYCLDPEYSYLAAKQIVSENLADHIDLNFGCPVKKVTKNGGGSAIPTNPKLLREIVRAVKSGIEDGLEAVKTKADRVVECASSGSPKSAKQLLAKPNSVPLSAKFRIGFDDDEINYLRTAEICIEEGCEMLTLHARTTAQFYSGQASWQSIKELRANTPEEVLVFGNGDIWSVNDALRMLETTNADGVCIGRGAMGRPWLFYDIARLFAGGDEQYAPTLGEVVDIMLRHLHRTIAWITTQNELSHPNSTRDSSDSKSNYERVAVRAFRANIGAYLKGFNLSKLKAEIMNAATANQISDLLHQLDLAQPYPTEVGAKPRGRTKAAKKVYLPRHW